MNRLTNSQLAGDAILGLTTLSVFFAAFLTWGLS
jgi:hypothetical protein